MRIGQKFITARTYPSKTNPSMMDWYPASAQIIGFEQESGAVLVEVEGEQVFMSPSIVRKEIQQEI